MKIGEGTSAPATVNATSGILDIEIDSKLEDITCTSSNEEIVMVDTPDVEFTSRSRRKPEIIWKA